MGDQIGGGVERVGDRAAAGDRQGGADLSVDDPDEEVAARNLPGAVERGEAADGDNVVGGRLRIAMIGLVETLMTVDMSNGAPQGR